MRFDPPRERRGGGGGGGSRCFRCNLDDGHWSRQCRAVPIRPDRDPPDGIRDTWSAKGYEWYWARDLSVYDAQRWKTEYEKLKCANV